MFSRYRVVEYDINVPSEDAHGVDGTLVSKQPKTDGALEEVCSAITDVYSCHIHKRRNLYPQRKAITRRIAY